MSENILSVEDLKFLEQLQNSHGLHTLRYDDGGISINNDAQLSAKITQGEGYGMLSEIGRKLRYRLDSDFQLNFLDGIRFDVVKL